MLDLTQRPEKDWVQSKAAYIELTKPQNDKTYWKLPYPTLELRQQTGPSFTLNTDGYVEMHIKCTWAVKYSYYNGIDQRSWDNFPNYAFLRAPRGLFGEHDPIVVSTATGQGIYFKVYEHKQANWSRGNPIYALMDSEGTVRERKATNKTKQDATLLEEYDPVSL